MSKTEAEQDALHFACPACGSPPEHFCMALNAGPHIFCVHPHQERMLYAALADMERERLTLLQGGKS